MPAQSFPMLLRRVYGFECPRAEVPLVVSTIPAEVRINFILDTGAAVTLIPIPVANALAILNEEKETDPQDRPSSFGARLEGFRTQIKVQLLGRQLDLPCFFYQPPAAPVAAPPQGTPGRRTAPRPPDTLPEWEERMNSHGGEAEAGPATGPPCILGRLGFLNRHSILIQDRQLIISTDRIVPPQLTQT